MKTNSAKPLLDFALSVPHELPIAGTKARKDLEDGFLKALSDSMGNDSVVHPAPYSNSGYGYIDFETDVDLPGMPKELTVVFRLTIPKDEGRPYILAVAMDRILGTEYAYGDQLPIENPLALAKSVAEKARSKFSTAEKTALGVKAKMR